MADVVTFDGPNKLIIEISAAGDNALDMFEIYSEWKVWCQISDNLKFLQAFTPVGGDPITATEALAITYFLENGWRIRPAEVDHILALNGNVYTREPGESIAVPTLGAFTVEVRTQVSAIVSAIETIAPISDEDYDEFVTRLMLYVMENGESFAEAMRLIRADAAGSILKSGTLHEVRNAAGTQTRITANADEDGRDVTDTDGT